MERERARESHRWCWLEGKAEGERERDESGLASSATRLRRTDRWAGTHTHEEGGNNVLQFSGLRERKISAEMALHLQRRPRMSDSMDGVTHWGLKPDIQSCSIIHWPEWQFAHWIPSSLMEVGPNCCKYVWMKVTQGDFQRVPDKKVQGDS